MLGQRGVASSAVRRSNLSLILTHLHLAGPATRSELCDATGLTRSSVAALVGDLEEVGLVTETPTASAGRPGRPSPRVGFADGPAVLAMEVQVDSVAVAWVSLGGQLLSVQRRDRPRNRISAQDTISDLVDLAVSGADAVGHPSLLAIGVSVIGLTRSGTGNVSMAPNLGWREVPFRQLLIDDARLTSALGPLDRLPIDLQSQGGSGAMAELRRGAARGYEHLIYVDTEVGMGGGLIADSELLRGAAGYGGEIGHMVVNPGGRLCACGGSGCWETEAGERAVLARAGLNPSGGRAEVDRLIGRARSGDGPEGEAARAAFAEAGTWLAMGLSNLALILNPQVLVLGGMYQQGFPFVEQAISDVFGDQPLLPAQELPVVPSALGIDASLIGASELAFDRVLTDPIGLASGSSKLPARR